MLNHPQFIQRNASLNSQRKIMAASNSQKYGVPFYGASWVPPNALRSAADHGEDAAADVSPPSLASEDYLVFAGGGGEGRSGIPNAVVISHFDFASNSLSDQPVKRLGTDGDLPYRMAVHPGGDGVICSMPNCCRLFEWDEVTIDDAQRLTLKPSERVLDQLQDIGQQLAITFSDDGSVLAVGGEDGKLRVFKWPSMETIIDEAKVHISVKDLDFSPDGKFLVSVGSGGPGRVWDVASSKPIATLSKKNIIGICSNLRLPHLNLNGTFIDLVCNSSDEISFPFHVQDEIFGSCRFSHTSDNNLFLYITAMRDQGGSIIKWNTSSWTRINSKHIVQDPICAFNVSVDGKLLAIGTIQGDIHILNSSSMRVQTLVKKAHLGLVTALTFSHNSRALVSASLDASARVTLIEEENKKGMNLWIILLVMLLAAALYYAKMAGFLPYRSI